MIIDIVNNIFLKVSSYFFKMSGRVDLSPVGPKFGIDALPDGFGNLRQAASETAVSACVRIDFRAGATGLAGSHGSAARSVPFRRSPQFGR